MKWLCPLSEATCVVAEVCGDRSISTFCVFPNRVRGRPTVGPFEIDHIINPSAVHLKLSQLLKVYLTFRVSWVKTVTDLDLLPLSEPPRLLMVAQPTQFGIFWTSADDAAYNSRRTGGKGGGGYVKEELTWIPQRKLIIPPHHNTCFDVQYR